jgi:Tol biopolymer transport system component
LGRDDSGPSWGDYAPKWSPDGKRIVFESTRNDPKGQLYSIYVMNDNGSGLRELAGTDAELPSWSPDGEHIVYVQGQLNYDQYDEAVYGGGGRIMVMEADGSGKRELAFSGSTDAVRWSPDGRWIAYEAHSHDSALNSRPAVFIIHLDGSGLRLIARDAFSPSWSPDGKLLAFSDGDGSLFSDHRPTVLRVSSGKELDLAWGPSGQSDSIAWSPDGSKIAFIAGEVPVTAPAPNASVYVAVANADGNFVATSPPENLEAVTEIHGLAWLPGSRDRVIYYGPKGAFLSSINGGHDVY